MPWADVLYGCDGEWWRKAGPARDSFTGLRVTRDRVAARDLGLLEVPAVPRSTAMVLQQRGVIGWGGNSGFQAVNLVAQWGCRMMAWVGFDMRADLGIHYFGRHLHGLNNPSASSLRRWGQTLDEAAPRLAAAGIEVVNCSPVSALCAYPKMTLAEALAHFEARRGEQCPVS